MVLRHHWGLGVGHAYAHSLRQPDKSCEGSAEAIDGSDIEEESEDAMRGPVPRRQAGTGEEGVDVAEDLGGSDGEEEESKESDEKAEGSKDQNDDEDWDGDGDGDWEKGGDNDDGEEADWILADYWEQDDNDFLQSSYD